MNLKFKTFLKNRPVENTDGCSHDSEHWCNNCVNFGQEVAVTLPDGTISRGRLHTNLEKNPPAIPLLEEKEPKPTIPGEKPPNTDPFRKHPYPEGEVGEIPF